MSYGPNRPISEIDTVTTGELLQRLKKKSFTVIWFKSNTENCHNRNVSHSGNMRSSLCRTPNMAAVVGQTVQGREPPQRDVPLLDTRPVEVEEEEENAEEEVSCYKEVVPQDKVQLDLSSQQQRDVAVLMGDTPSPAPSVVSIRSELTDDEEEDPQKCRLTE